MVDEQTKAEELPQEKIVEEVKIDMANPPVHVPGMKLNIGSGVDYKEGYINVDKFDSSADANWDIKSLPLYDNTVAHIFMSQVLEHISREEAPIIVKEFHRVLKPNGNLVMTVPDIISVCENVINHPDDEWRIAHVYGNQTHEGQFHKWGYTPESITRLLGFAGFRFIGTALFGSALGIKEIWVEAKK